MKKQIIFLLVLIAFSCNNSKDNKEVSVESPSIEIAEMPILNLAQANTLAQLPLHCINTEYPNRLSQTLGGDDDLKSPSALHPAFYGCFDWHSSVHGHWSLVSLLKPSVKAYSKCCTELVTNSC